MSKLQKIPVSGRLAKADLVGLSPELPHKGLGAVSNPTGRFETQKTEVFYDDWCKDEDELTPDVSLNWHREFARTIITRNQSPDISFDRSINPYRGCEHGCIYCFARPSHNYLGHSAGRDFERELYFKTNAVDLLRKELSSKNYAAAPDL